MRVSKPPVRESYIDFHRVEPRHREIDRRLYHWSLWVRPRVGARVHPMWKGRREDNYGRTVSDHPLCNPADCAAIEKAVFHLPEKHRDAIRWVYIYHDLYRISPKKAAMNLGESLEGLALLIQHGRDMLCNRGT